MKKIKYLLGSDFEGWKKAATKEHDELYVNRETKEFYVPNNGNAINCRDWEMYYNKLKYTQIQ